MLLQEQQKNVVMLDMALMQLVKAVYLDFASAITRYGIEQAKIHNISNPSDAKIYELGQKNSRGKIRKLIPNV